MRQETLTHVGILGMRWGVRRSKTGYRSKSIKAAVARRSNDKVDDGFKRWDENVKKRDSAIAAGKKVNASKLAYEKNKTDKTLKTAYKQDNKDFKKALKTNTTYRKGVVKKEVGQDAARKYLSEAKKIKKQLDTNPGDKKLKKTYTDLMNKYDVERAHARTAEGVYAKRSRKKAALKGAFTKSVKVGAATAVVAAGVLAVKKYAAPDMKVDSAQVLGYVKTAKDILGYVHF